MLGYTESTNLRQLQGPMMSEAAKQKKARLAEALKNAILTLELRPGSDLDEVQLSEEYGLSRTPLREVLRELAGEGYLALHPNRGARVSEMSHVTLREFFLTAPMVYGAVLQLAAEHAEPAQVVELKEAQMQFRTALKTGTSKERALWNNRFHAITGDMAHNIYLQPSFNRLLIDHARIGMTFYRPNNQSMAENLALAAEQHDAIIDSIAAGDAETARQLASDHWNLSRDQIELFVTPPGLDMSLGQPARKTSA